MNNSSLDHVTEAWVREQNDRAWASLLEEVVRPLQGVPAVDFPLGPDDVGGEQGWQPGAFQRVPAPTPRFELPDTHAFDEKLFGAYVRELLRRRGSWATTPT